MGSVLKTASLEPLWLGMALWPVMLSPSFAFHLFFFYSTASAFLPLQAPLAHTFTVFTAGSLTVCWPTIEIKFTSLFFSSLSLWSTFAHSFGAFFVVVPEYLKVVLFVTNLFFFFHTVHGVGISKEHFIPAYLYSNRGIVCSASIKVISPSISYNNKNMIMIYHVLCRRSLKRMFRFTPFTVCVCVRVCLCVCVWGGVHMSEWVGRNGMS